LLDMVMTMLSDLRMNFSQRAAVAKEETVDMPRGSGRSVAIGQNQAYEWAEKQVQGIINDVNGITRQMPPTSRKWPIA